MVKNPLIAFAGYARAGKDVAASALVEIGYTRIAFGNVIKAQVDELVKTHLGFSAFTEDDTQKTRIRQLLEVWGDTNYQAILNEVMRTLPAKAVNARLVRIPEAEAWVQRGGVIVEIVRPGWGPASQWEHDRLEELRANGFISSCIEESDREMLKVRARELAYN